MKESEWRREPIKLALFLSYDQISEDFIPTFAAKWHTRVSLFPVDHSVCTRPGRRGSEHVTDDSTSLRWTSPSCQPGRDPFWPITSLDFSSWIHCLIENRLAFLSQILQVSTFNELAWHSIQYCSKVWGWYDLCFWKKSLMLTKAAFLCSSKGKNSNIVEYYYNLK